MTKKLDITKPPFQTDEDPPRKAELLWQGMQGGQGLRDVWLITTPEGIQYPAMRMQDGSPVQHGEYAIVNAPRCIPFWILLNQQGLITRVSTLQRMLHTGWRGPFYMDEDGNPVSGGDE